MADQDIQAQMEQIRKDVQRLGIDKAGKAIENAAAYMLKVIQTYPLKSTRQDDPRKQATSALYKPARKANWVDDPDGQRRTVAQFLQERLGAKADKKGRFNGFQKSESNRRKVENFKGRQSKTIYTIGKDQHSVEPQPVTYLRQAGEKVPRSWSAGQFGHFDYFLRKSWHYEMTQKGVVFLIRGQALGGKSDEGFLQRLDQGGTFTLPKRIIGYKAFIQTTRQGKLTHKEVFFYPQYEENPRQVHVKGYKIAASIIQKVKDRFHLK